MAKAHVGRHAFEGPKEEAKALLPKGTKDRLRKLGKRRGLDFADIMREALRDWERQEHTVQAVERSISLGVPVEKKAS